MNNSKSFKALQNIWYDKLKSDGFSDIEDMEHPNSPLIEWHSFKIPSNRFQMRKLRRSDYQSQIDKFIHNPGFMDACKSVIKHGNCKFTLEQTILIWDLHTQGSTTRDIAKKLNRSKGRTDDVIAKLRIWMNLL